MSKVVTIGDEEFEIIPSESVAASKILVDTHNKLGKPDTPLSENGKKMMQVIISVWQDLYPEQVKEHKERIKNYRDSEMTVGEQVKNKTGRSLASIPPPVYHMCKKIFPEFKFDNRDDILSFVEEFPLFKVTAEHKGGGYISIDKKDSN